MKPSTTLRSRLTETARIAPREYAYCTSRSRMNSLTFALAGWLFMLRRQKNTWIMAVATLVVVLAAIWLRIDTIGIALLVTSITLVWILEFVNAAIESCIDLSTSEFHPMAKVGKDVAAGAVLLGVLHSLVIASLVFGPPLWEFAAAR